MKTNHMLQSVRLVRFKGFQDCLVPLSGTSVLVGANNAGKTSVISGLRLVAAMIPQMRRQETNIGGEVDGQALRGWRLTNAAVDAASFNDQNVRFNFGTAQTRFEARFTSGARVVLVWPDPDEDYGTEPSCHLIPPKGYRGSFRAAARDLVPAIGVVPTLSPLDDQEPLIGDEALRKNLTGRRTSRYFRNALLRTRRDGDWDGVVAFLLRQTPELDHLELSQSAGHRSDELDLYFQETGRRQLREATWAGDGMQIWLQALYHIWRERESSVLVLDEPDVYLHPDLQRRLARLIFGLPKQVVLATHSTEILAEAEPGSAVWVDRERRRAERPKPDGALTLMGRRLGSGLELSVARALRSSVALFVEGQDMRVLGSVASVLGAEAVAAGRDYSVVSLGGLSRFGVAGAFAEVIAALGGNVAVQVLLDRDLRCDDAVVGIMRELSSQGATVHVWHRRELENYLLCAPAIARMVEIDESLAASLLEDALEKCKKGALTDLQTQRLEEQDKGIGTTKAISAKTVLQNCELEFADLWRSNEGRLTVVDAKRAISALNTQLQARKLRTVNADGLARHLTIDDVVDEMKGILLAIERAITG